MAQEYKSPRKIEEIRAEYAQLCMRVGEMQYRKQAAEKDIEMLNNQIQELHFESMARAEADAKAAAEKAEKEKTEAASKEDAKKEASVTADAAPSVPVKAGE